MDDQQLVELLRESLPQDLSGRQIDSLREAIRTSAEVRATLLEELHLEEAIATRLAPELAGRAQLAARLSELEARRRRSPWRWAWMLLLLVVVVGAAAYAAVAYYERFLEQRQIAIANGVSTVDVESIDDGAKHPSTGDDPRPRDVPAASTPDTDPDADGQGDVSPKPPTPIDDRPQLPAPVRDPAWRLFDDAPSRGDYSWLSRVDEVISNRNNAQFQRDEAQYLIHLNGKYELTPPDDRGRVVRLRLGGMQRLKLQFHCNDEIALIEWVNGSTLRGSLGRLPDDANPGGLPAEIDQRFRRQRMLTRIDPGIDLSWHGTSPKVNGIDIGTTQIAIRWTGRIAAPRDGRYRFTTTSDDGVALLVNGHRVIHNWTDHSTVENHGEVELAAGAHDLELQYYQSAGEAKIKLEWQGPGIDRQVIPADVLRPPADATAGSESRGLQGLYCFGPPRPAPPPIEFSYLTSDLGRYHYFRRGAIDLRYQDGEVLVARGDVVLLALPVAAAPSRVEMETQGVLRLAELLYLGPLPRAADVEIVRQPPIDEGRKAPAELEWTVGPPELNEQVELDKQADGSIVFRRQQDSEAELWAWTPIDIHAGVEVILELDETTPGTGFVFDAYDGRHTFVIARRPQGDVLCSDPANSAHVDQMRQSVGLVDQHFFCRIRYGFEHVIVDVSNQGRDWRELWRHALTPGQTSPAQVKVGIAARYQGGPRGIRLHSITIRRPTAIESLANAALVNRAQKVIVELEKLWKPGNPRVSILALDDQRPSDVTIWRWRIAACAAAMRVAPQPAARATAATMLLDAAIAGDIAFEALLEAFVELPSRVVISADKSQPCSWSAMEELWGALAAREQLLGNGQHVDALLDAWYRQDWGIGGRGYGPSIIAPVGLVRLCLHEIWSRDDMAALRRVAMRYMYLERHSDGWLHSDHTNKETIALADWMMAAVRRRFPEMPVVSSTAHSTTRLGDLRHPLVIAMDRESANTVSEFLVAVRDGQFPHACRMLTQRSVPGGIVPVDVDGDLSKAVFKVLREQIDAHPDLADLLQREYESLGQLRLRQLVQQGRYDALESLATQFRGTQAARAAVLSLADRDLATGNFFSAAARYDETIDGASVTEANTIQAKRRLALAMTGQLVGEPISSNVQFSGHEMPPSEFEALVKRLAAERRSEGVGNGETKNTPLAPRPRTMQLMAGDRLAFDPRPGRPYDAAWSIQGRHLAVHTGTQLYLIDGQSKKVKWKKNQHPHPPARKQLGNSSLAPLLLSDRLVAVHRPDAHTRLACFDIEGGKEQWNSTLAGEIASEPVLIAPWIYVITAQDTESAGYVDVVLHRVSPRTGESVLAKRLLQLRDGKLSLNAGRPHIAGDALLVRISGALVCCDLLGNVRWIRRLPIVPETADSELYRPRDPVDAMLVDGDRVVLGSRGSPMLVCVDVGSGELLWSRIAPDFRRVVGSVGGNIVITSSGRIAALHRDTGDVVWQQRLAADPQSVLIAEDDSLMTIALAHPTGTGTFRRRRAVREIQWLSAADGQVKKTVTLDQHADDVHDCQDLITDGRIVFGLSHATREPKNLRLFWVEPK